jgi:hypothetical protein
VFRRAQYKQPKSYILFHFLRDKHDIKQVINTATQHESVFNWLFFWGENSISTLEPI